MTLPNENYYPTPIDLLQLRLSEFAVAHHARTYWQGRLVVERCIELLHGGYFPLITDWRTPQLVPRQPLSLCKFLLQTTQHTSKLFSFFTLGSLLTAFDPLIFASLSTDFTSSDVIPLLTGFSRPPVISLSTDFSPLLPLPFLISHNPEPLLPRLIAPTGFAARSIPRTINRSSLTFAWCPRTRRP